MPFKEFSYFLIDIYRSQSLKSKSYGKNWFSVNSDSMFGEESVDIPGVFYGMSTCL